jgi:hypothetical protein
MRRAGLAALVLVLFAGAVVLPWLGEQHEYAGEIVQPPPVQAPATIKLDVGSRLCFGNAVIERHSDIARFRVGTFRQPGVPLTLSIGGARYKVSGAYEDNALISVPIRRPARDTVAEVCIRNEGNWRVDVYGANDRTQGRNRVTADGVPVEGAVEFSLWEAKRHSIPERMPETMDRIAVFRPGFTGPWLFWPLAVLFALGVPLLVLWGLARALGED